VTESRESESLGKDVKIFNDLDKEIVQSGQCCSCGACVAYCESQSFDVIKMENYVPKFKSEENAEKCTECGLCYYICPQTDTLLSQLNSVFEMYENEVGHIIDLVAAKTTDKSIRKVGQDGGVVSTILYYLFTKHKIDAAIVSEYDENLIPSPKIIFGENELLHSAGTRYSISSQILPLKDLYNLSPDVLKEKGITDIEQLKIAFVGTPCQVRAIRKMNLLNVKPAHVIKYVISLFCYENFDYDKLYEIIKDQIKIKPENIKKTWIKKNFFVLDNEGKEYEIDIKTLNPAVRTHCHNCDKFTGRFSDISVGASGAPQGYSMIVTRTELGQDLINLLISKGYLEKYEVPIEKAKEWTIKKAAWLKKMTNLKNK
jgi:coenzyme F420 hydrogenase subunit beta